MHSLLTAVFTFLTSLTQPQTVHHSQIFIPPEQVVAAARLEPGSRSEFAPTRQQVAHSVNGRDYADEEWGVSAHKMNASFSAR
jgi:hypothetical protein